MIHGDTANIDELESLTAPIKNKRQICYMIKGYQ